MPPFTPNEYLYKTHGSEGMEKWQIYAEAVREAMCEQTGLIKHNQSFKELDAYLNFMRGKSNEQPWLNKWEFIKKQSDFMIIIKELLKKCRLTEVSPHQSLRAPTTHSSITWCTYCSIE